MRTFLRSVIQATDSTCTGCRAKTAPASHAPGTFKRASTRQSCQNLGKEPGATAFVSDESRNIAQHCCIERDSRRRSATEIVQLQAVLFHRRNSFRGA